jgi:hypothetical protein|nr:MAG TPA: hypothetical protein [Caudoviricetes sp.]
MSNDEIQEIDMSKDERTRKEIYTCYTILKGNGNE